MGAPRSHLDTFFSELKRRHVFRVAVVYAIVGWIVIQAADIIFPALHLPQWSITLVVTLILLGFPVALVLAWAYDITPEGVVRTDERAAVPAPRRSPTAGVVGREANGQKRTRLIVLPFRMLRPDPETDFLAFSLPDAITSSLSGLQSLVVRSSLAAQRFSETPELSTLAREAEVDVVLTGTLLRMGETLRARAELTEVHDGTLLWSQSQARSSRIIRMTLPIRAG